MKARVLKPFADKTEGVTRKTGDTFTLSKERYEEINSTIFGVMVEAVAEEPAKPKKKTREKG
jgi:hypothetical protein